MLPSSQRYTRPPSPYTAARIPSLRARVAAARPHCTRCVLLSLSLLILALPHAALLGGTGAPLPPPLGLASLAGGGVAVANAMDLGDPLAPYGSVHPRNKTAVAARLGAVMGEEGEGGERDGRSAPRCGNGRGGTAVGRLPKGRPQQEARPPPSLCPLPAPQLLRPSRSSTSAPCPTSTPRTRAPSLTRRARRSPSRSHSTRPAWRVASRSRPRTARLSSASPRPSARGMRCKPSTGAWGGEGRMVALCLLTLHRPCLLLGAARGTTRQLRSQPTALASSSRST